MCALENLEGREVTLRGAANRGWAVHCSAFWRLLELHPNQQPLPIKPNQIMWTQVINFQSLCLSKPEQWNLLEIANPDILIAIDFSETIIFPCKDLPAST